MNRRQADSLTQTKPKQPSGRRTHREWNPSVERVHLLEAIDNLSSFGLGAQAAIERSIEVAAHALMLDPLTKAVCHRPGSTR